MILRRRSRAARPAVALPVVVLGLLLTLTAGCTAPAHRPTAYAEHEVTGFVGGVVPPQPYVMPDQTLTDTEGRAYNLASTPSRPVTLLFFGYTHCPDVCVAVLSDVALTLQRMDAARRAQVQVVFVTTDPARDTGPVVRAYLDRFDPGFVGLTGDLATITRVAAQVGVDIQGTAKRAGGGYDVGHSAQVIGFDHTRGVVMWPPGTPVGDLRSDVSALVDRAR